MTAGDLAALAAIVVAGPFGLVLLAAIVRGYELRVSLTRPREPDQGDDDEGPAVSTGRRA